MKKEITVIFRDVNTQQSWVYRYGDDFKGASRLVSSLYDKGHYEIEMRVEVE